MTSVHEAGNPVEYVQAKVQYDAVLGQKNTTDIDITFNEPVQFPVVDHEHSYEDIPLVTIPAYSIGDFCQKLCSLYQRARDYYDIYRLFNQEQFDDQVIYTALQKRHSHTILPSTLRTALRMTILTRFRHTGTRH